LHFIVCHKYTAFIFALYKSFSTLNKPEYPDIYFGATFSEYMKMVLKKMGSFGYGSQLAGKKE